MHKPELAWQGYNLYSGNETGIAILFDMEGNNVHEWDLNSDEKYHNIWPLAILCDNGDLVAYCKDSALIRYGWNSEQKWVQEFRPHHDIAIDVEGNIYVPGRRDAVIRMWGWIPVPVLDDLVTIVSPDGKIINNTPLAQAASKFIPSSNVVDIYIYLLHPKRFRNTLKSIFFDKFAFYSGTPFDVLHTNSTDFLDRNIENVGKKGDLIVSMRNLNIIGIIDPKTENFIWTWGQKDISGQHNAKFLENDNILLFDNGTSRGYSRAIELDPTNFEIVWEYTASEPKDFYSYRRGGCQRLPNGNTLITESDKGHVFEITALGQIVWDFYQPELSEDKQTRRSIRYMYRISPNSSALKHIKVNKE
jgi:outer membrane protein assembly factor BamB